MSKSRVDDAVGEAVAAFNFGYQEVVSEMLETSGISGGSQTKLISRRKDIRRVKASDLREDDAPFVYHICLLKKQRRNWKALLMRLEVSSYSFKFKVLVTMCY